MVGGPRYQGVAAGGASDFPGVMLDGIAGAVVLPADRRLRAAAIAGLVDELLKALFALHDPDLEVEEIASLQRVAAAAHAHLTRMNVLNSAGGKG